MSFDLLGNLGIDSTPVWGDEPLGLAPPVDLNQMRTRLSHLIHRPMHARNHRKSFFRAWTRAKLDLSASMP
jgi:hypothetical protein